jgi:GT2 family glycosyltransferase/Flp pilus assembly protein TadD
VTNYASPPQQIPVDYADLSRLDEFAARRAREYAHKALQFERLTGFCLLARREVLEQVGGFDECYGLGFFDDDDLCIRAREAGFRLLVALNVYIHHFGSRTFTGLGIDCPRQLQDNFEQFKAKWGRSGRRGIICRREVAPKPLRAEAQRTQSNNTRITRRPLRATLAAPARAGVSLCMIVKNEEANLAAALQSVTNLVDEIIVADTGSTDQTKEIAALFGAKVVDFPWVDSFAAARNEALRHATCAWIFWMDADDRIDEANRLKLRALFARLADENAAYVMTCLCLPDPITGVATEVKHVRLFRNHPEIRWRYRVHEQIQPAVRRLGGTPRFVEVVVQHTGYLDLSLRQRKRERDLRLLQLDHAEHPDDPFILFNLGMTHLDTQPAEALPYLRRSLELSDPGDSIVCKLYYMEVQCHRALGQPAEALAACRAGRVYYPDDAELLSQEGQLLAAAGDAAGAEACFLRLLQAREADHFASVPNGLHGFRTRDHLATLYWQAGRLAEAEAQWRAAVAEQPGYGPAWQGLEDLYAAQGRWTELEEVIGHLASLPRATVEAEVARARLHLGRREFAAARQVLDEAIARAPDALRPRVVLSHVLLQEGRDPCASERALREVLALAPGHAEATRNLTVLLRQQG